MEKKLGNRLIGCGKEMGKEQFGAIVAPSCRTGLRAFTLGGNFFWEHELGSSLHETTSSPSLASAKGFFAKLWVYRRHEGTRCTCPKGHIELLLCEDTPYTAREYAPFRIQKHRRHYCVLTRN